MANIRDTVDEVVICPHHNVLGRSMSVTELYNKSKKVIESCETLEQLKVARSFLELGRRRVIVKLSSRKSSLAIIRRRSDDHILNGWLGEFDELSDLLWEKRSEIRKNKEI